MKCVNENKLSAFLDGELEGQERALVRKHLEGCPSCRKRAQEHKAVWELLDSMQDLEPVPSIASVVSQKALERQKKLRLERILVPLMTSAVAVVSLFVGCFLGSVIYEEISGSSTTVASVSGEQSVPSLSYGAYPDMPSMEFYNNMEEGGN
jgi:anti-sigma factor RsiW